MSEFEIKDEKSKESAPIISSSQIKKTKKEAETKNEAPETPKYSDDELLKIFDDIIFNGEYTEDMKLKSKLSVAFRTRTSSEISEITNKLDTTPANLRSTLEERRALLNLQYALVKYHGKDISSAKVEDKEKFIGNLPAPVIGALLVALARFDDKVYAACKVGEENF